jgi:hypothetical protein
MLDKIWKFIEYNRWLCAALVLVAVATFGGFYCTPLTQSPMDTARMVDERQLAIDYKTWQSEQTVTAAKFESAGEDLQEQAARNTQIENMIGSLATGQLPDVPGFLKLLLGAGGIGAVYDNIRKRGLITGLKITAKNGTNGASVTNISNVN